MLCGGFWLTALAVCQKAADVSSQSTYGTSASLDPAASVCCHRGSSGGSARTSNALRSAWSSEATLQDCSRRAGMEAVKGKHDNQTHSHNSIALHPVASWLRD
eukprot:5447649-Amphidinium_carterae.1